ncbi:MAG: MFS transporter [Xenococcaceae cyanobacterium]
MTQTAQTFVLQAVAKRFLAWIPALKREIWILAAGQLLLYIGQGFTLVYASIYFVNQLGFSTTQVGLALGSSSISGILGRFWAGSAIDSHCLGRRGTLLLAATISALASFCLALTDNFPTLIVGNLLMGLGISLYWPATLAVITDLTEPHNRTEGFALIRLADSLGLGLGALLAGQFIAISGNYRALFITKGVSYLIFLAIIYGAIAETCQPQATPRRLVQSWLQALGDRLLVIWLAANIFFTTYEAQIHSTMPLYLANFVPGGGTETGFTEKTIGFLFFWHIFLKILLQLPITRWLRLAHYTDALLVSLLLWGGGFVLIWFTGVVSSSAVIPAVCALSLLAVAEVVYLPSASSLVGELAPESLRGVYFSLESQCWAIGFLIGPALGGWALDRPAEIGRGFWLIAACSIGLGCAIVFYLRRQMRVPYSE